MLVALIGWIGFSVYQNVQKDVSHTYEMKTDALDNYLNDLNAETESTDETSAETDTEASSETVAQTETVSETAAE